MEDIYLCQETVILLNEKVRFFVQQFLLQISSFSRCVILTIYISVCSAIHQDLIFGYKFWENIIICAKTVSIGIFLCFDKKNNSEQNINSIPV